MTTTSQNTLTGTYALDASHTRIGFAARHAMVTKVRGQFGEFTGNAHLDFDNPANSSAEVVIQAASVTTGNSQRDDHLRTNDFFDAPTYPEIRFVSTGVEKVDDEHFTLSGDLTIKETTRPISVTFELTGAAVDPFGNQRVGFEGSTVINRRDWKVEWNAPLEAGGVLVSEKVTLEFEISAIKTDSE